MTPDQLEVLKVLGLSAVFLFQVNRLYNDLQKQHDEIMAELQAMTQEYISIKTRITVIEYRLGIDDPPTLPVRPPAPG